MTPLQNAAIAHAQVDGFVAMQPFNGKPLWQDYTKETSAILLAFLEIVTATSNEERAFLASIKDLAEG